MWLTADVFAQWYGFTDKFTPKFLIGTETSVIMPDKEGIQGGWRDGGREGVLKSAPGKIKRKFDLISSCRK